jgi:TIR domain
MTFRLLDKIDIVDRSTTRRIGLYEGDLAAIPPEHKVDILVVSAFPNDYIPTPTSLIGALNRQGLSVAALALDKLHDLRGTCAFWISHPITGPAARLNIGQIACFEPRVLGSPPSIVGDLFRGLFPFLIDDKSQVVAMPLLASGDQGWSAEVMLAAIIDAASHWFARGLPISELKIVVRPSVRNASLVAAMSGLGDAIVASAPKPSMAPIYDVFLSFSSHDSAAADCVGRSLEARNENAFDFRIAIDKGKSWQEEIDRAISSSRAIIALLSPSYFASPECTEELMQARLRNKRADRPVLFPIYWRDWGKELDLWLQVVNYSDCREANFQSLSMTVGKLTFA